MIIKKQQGFTLVEILIALSIFAVMSVIISSVLFTVFKTRSRVNEHADRLSELQFAVILMQRDFEQAILRSITDENGTPLPGLMGDSTHIEFTRTGYTNPLYQEQRSSLQRVAYYINMDKLMRKNWPSLDRTSQTGVSE